jgi:catechol 2,3-dioxygenase-like lactoylglutathione lyase family enzyme
MTTPPSSALIRASIFVRDIERSTRFYRTLGLTEVYFEGRLDDPSASTVLGFEHHSAYDVRILKRPGPNYGMVGLFELAADSEAEALPPPTGPARRGEVALIFYVKSMAAAMAALRDVGATWTPEPILFKLAHRQQLEVCIRDCDGVLVNLVETDPDDQYIVESELALAAQRLR